jgi:hypothetical protein
VHWNLVRVILVALEDDRFLTAHRLSNEVLESATVVSDLATPGTLSLGFRDRQGR